MTIATQKTAHRAQAFAGVALALPASALLLVLMLGPLLGVVLISFTNWQLGASSLDWIGLGNYEELGQDRLFRVSLVNTLIYTAIVVPVSLALGLGIAILIEAHSSLRAVYRLTYFLPVATTVVAMALVWEFILHPTLGPVNKILEIWGWEGARWLHDRTTVLWTLCVIGIWLKLGYYVILFIAGLKSIPRELYEAAEVDGASSPWSQFGLITWPLLAPVSLFVLVIAFIQSIQVFETVLVLTQGGPNKASEVLLHTLYQEGFAYFRVGYAAALTVVFLALVLIATLLKIRAARSQRALS